MMSSIEGVKTVDFTYSARGSGSVNNQGTVSVYGDEKVVNNHSIPKLRGYSNIGEDGRLKKRADFSLKDTPVYVSDNCIRHHLFKEEMPFHTGKLLAKHATNFLTSPVGYLRGYAITDKPPIMKKSPLFIGDLVDQEGKGNIEVFSTASSKNSETGGFFTKVTVGETRYEGYGSINIEELQFISLDGIFGRSAVSYNFTEDNALGLIPEIELMLQDISHDNNLDPKIKYNNCWIRKGSCMNVGEAGYLLNDDAIKILVEYMLDKIRNLNIFQAQGWLGKVKVQVDYNDNEKAVLRILDTLDYTQKTWTNRVACYYKEGSDEQRLESRRMSDIGDQIKASRDQKKEEKKEAKKKTAKKATKKKTIKKAATKKKTAKKVGKKKAAKKKARR